MGFACMGKHHRGGATRLKAEADENLALVFIKPHACTPVSVKVVPEFLKERGIRVLRSGSVSASEIATRGIIESHYASIARVGMSRDMAALGLSDSAAERFQAGYG